MYYFYYSFALSAFILVKLLGVYYHFHCVFMEMPLGHNCEPSRNFSDNTELTVACVLWILHRCHGGQLILLVSH